MLHRIEIKIMDKKFYLIKKEVSSNNSNEYEIVFEVSNSLIPMIY